MKFSIAAVALLVGNGLAVTQEEQAVANKQAVGVQETPEINEVHDIQAADDEKLRRPEGYGDYSYWNGYGDSYWNGQGQGDKHGPTGCKDEVRRVKATLEALLRQVDRIRCESCPKPKPTSRYTHRPTPTKKACATPTCGKHGVKFNRYSNPFSKDFSSSYKSFDLGYFLKQKPLESGIVTDISLTSDANNKTYANAAMEYRTFLFACQSGKYKFTSPKSDDITLMWFGDDHVKYSTRDNADICQSWYGENKPQTVYKNIKAGKYYPIRVLWGNTNGAGYLNLDIYAPNGQKLSGKNSKGKSYVVTENCQGNNPYGDKAKTASAHHSKPTHGSKPKTPSPKDDDYSAPGGY
ncbi:GLEYA motif domain-containing protein [Hirsutella rhossiliensis]|uniref:GLEYA domain-containing protein n=1 Tax=Hirsutella rhossiliensis TaxID=111463 RepID=A0A9P8MSM8_9HYPO|nr:GLEYA domain-containing protein [Hirsutella rhossiliensis]KAH0960429.1 GLEYA domain-containing protein [Hirsutella rhossiliensis]